MNFTWILFFVVVQLFRVSNGILDTNNNPICGDLSTRYLFFLVLPKTEISGLTKFLSNVHSATILKPFEQDGIAEVLCESKDWEKIYGYSKERDIYLLHTIYCVENSKYLIPKNLRSKREKLKRNEGVEDLLLEGSKSSKRIKNSLEELSNSKNIRILKTRGVNTMANKNLGESIKSQTITQSSITKKPLRKKSSKASVKRNKKPFKQSGKKSMKKKTGSKKNSNKTTKILPRSIKNDHNKYVEESGKNWLEKSFSRIKRYSWDTVVQNYNNHHVNRPKETQTRDKRSKNKFSSTSKPIIGIRGKLESSTRLLHDMDEVEITTEKMDKKRLNSFENDEETKADEDSNLEIKNPTENSDNLSLQPTASSSSSEMNMMNRVVSSGNRDCHHESKKKESMKLKNKKNLRKMRQQGTKTLPEFRGTGGIGTVKIGDFQEVFKEDDCSHKTGERYIDHHIINDSIDTWLNTEPDFFGKLINHLEGILNWVKDVKYFAEYNG